MEDAAFSGQGLTVAGHRLDNSDESFHQIEKRATVPEARKSESAFGSANRADISALENPIARQIVDAMKAASQAHHFDTVQDLIDEILFRLAAIDAMTKFNTGDYDMDYFNPDIGLEPRMGSTDAARLSRFWEFMFPDELWDAEFAQTTGTTASKAMAPVENASFPFRGECAGAFQMAVYFGLLNGLGPDRFDEMAAQWGKMYVGPWRIGPNEAPNPATLFMPSAPLDDPHIPGDYIYFRNKDDYIKWAPDGFWMGLNSMVMFNDDLGTPHYSGMGASWLSEPNLRSSLVNAYYHDCYPHTISHPLTEVRFTQRSLLKIPKQIETTVTDTGKTGTRNRQVPTSETLLFAGFTAENGVYTHSGTSLGQLAEALNFSLSDLRQVQSAGEGNPPHHVRLGNVSVVIRYEDGTAARTDPNAAVTAHVNLDAKTKG